MNIDWSKAPEDATHYSPGGDVYSASWIKWVNGELHGWLKSNDTSWGRLPFQEKDLDQISLHVDRPKKQDVWHGEGLPPVNCFCEALDEYADSWFKVEIYAHTEFMGETHACARNGTDMFYGLAHEFRPIKTAEQLAEEEKKKVIDDMQRIYEESMLDYSSRLGHASRPAIKALYEAGYRKQ